MNDDTSPFEPNELDELLSAELDGELDAAARDLGLSMAELSERRRVTPGAEDRRAALAAARDLLSEPPEIEELLAARLRAKAVRAGREGNASRRGDRSRRRRQILLAAGGLAAAIAAVVGIAAGLSASRSGTSADGAKRALAASAAPKATTPGPASALGPFANVHALALAAVSGANAQQSGNKPATAVGQPTLGPPNAAQATPGQSTDNAFKTPSAAARSTATGTNNTGLGAAGRQCTSRPQVLHGDSLVLRATATLSGKPVVVLVFTGDGEHTVVIEDTNCSLLNVQMLG
jgi:hypothetical protein